MNKTIWEFFINKKRFTIILSLAIAVIGLASMALMPKESNPEVSFPIGVITTVYPGASAEDVEELITDVIEDKVINISEIESVTSTSMKGMSSIVVQFDVDSDSLEKITELKDEVDKAKVDLPSDAEDPIVDKVSFDNEPVLRLALSGPYSLEQLKSMAEDLKKEIERSNGVSEVNIIGGQEREIKIIVDKVALDNFGLALTDITSAVSQANTDIPVGTIETAGEEYTLRFAGRLTGVEDIENTPITALGNSPVFVKDVAEVVDGFTEKESISRLSINGAEPMTAISLNILKISGGNILKTVDGVKEVIEEAKENILSENVEVAIIDDMAELVRDDLNGLSVNGLETMAIVMLLLLIFVGWRESLLAGISIPLTFMFTFIILNYIGYTLNFITLFSLILSLGVLVDSSIVVTEDINKKIREGKKPKEAAISTVREFQAPLISGTLTTVFAFLPIMLTSGIIGKFIRSLPVTVTIVLLASLFSSLGVITTLASIWLKNEKADSGNKKSNGIINRFSSKYESILNTLFNIKKVRRLFVYTISVLFLLSLALPISGVLQVNLFSDSDSSYFAVNIEQPYGTPLENTLITAKQVEELFLQDDRVESLQTNVGSSFSSDSLSGGGGSGDYLAHVIVNLVEDRKEGSYDIAEEYRKKIANIYFGVAEVEVSELGSGPSSGSPVQISVSGDSLDVLESISEDIKDILKNIPEAVDAGTSVQETNGEFLLNIDRAKAKIYGVSTAQVAGMLRNAVSGTEAAVLHEDGEDIDIIVRYALSDDIEKINQTTLDELTSLTIATAQGEIPLSSFIESSLDNSRVAISHEDGERVVKVTADTAQGVTAQAVVKKAKEQIDKMNIPDGYFITYGGEQEDVVESFTDMLKALILGVFMIALLLVLQFNSYRQPLFILIAIPLSLIGILPGLVMMNQPLSFAGVIGIVALAGIVINNAILLIDAINNNRREGMDIDTAIITAGKSRLQPIILTTITTVSGVLPLAMADPMWAPIAYSIIFGLLFSTILTLVVVPLLYRRFGERVLD